MTVDRGRWLFDDGYSTIVIRRWLFVDSPLTLLTITIDVQVGFEESSASLFVAMEQVGVRSDIYELHLRKCTKFTGYRGLSIRERNRKRNSEYPHRNLRGTHHRQGDLTSEGEHVGGGENPLFLQSGEVVQRTVLHLRAGFRPTNGSVEATVPATTTHSPSFRPTVSVKIETGCAKLSLPTKLLLYNFPRWQEHELQIC